MFDGNLSRFAKFGKTIAPLLCIILELLSKFIIKWHERLLSLYIIICILFQVVGEPSVVNYLRSAFQGSGNLWDRPTWNVVQGLAPCMLNCFVIVWTHWGGDKMAVIFQTTFSNALSWMKMYHFRIRFHWSLFLRVQLTVFQHWFI